MPNKSVINCFITLLFFCGCSGPAVAQFGRYIGCVFPAGWEGREVKLIINPLNQLPIIDTATVIDRHVIFNASLTEPATAYIWVAGNKDDITFLIDSPQITITVDSLVSDRAVVAGSPGGDVWRQQRTELARLRESQADLRSAFREGHPLNDPLSELRFAQLTDSLGQVYNDRVTRLIEDNPSAVASWLLFADYYPFLPYATAVRLLGRLVSFSTYPSYKEVTENIYQKRPGIKAADFRLPDLFGDTIRLSTLKSKFTLIDFSSTLMTSCALRHQALRKIYETYHPTGLEILTVSMEFNAPEAKQALMHEFLPWTVLIVDMNVTKSAVFNDYKVVKTPDNVLLDSRSIILGRDLSPADLAIRLKELMRTK